MRCGAVKGYSGYVDCDTQHACREINRISGADYPRLTEGEVYKRRMSDLNSVILTTLERAAVFIENM
jgi:hypothetical protein